LGFEEIAGTVALIAVIGFIGWRVLEAKNKEPNDSSDVGGSGRPGDKYPNQDKK